MPKERTMNYLMELTEILTNAHNSNVRADLMDPVNFHIDINPTYPSTAKGYPMGTGLPTFQAGIIDNGPRAYTNHWWRLLEENGMLEFSEHRMEQLRERLETGLDTGWKYQGENGQAQLDKIMEEIRFIHDVYATVKADNYEDGVYEYNKFYRMLVDPIECSKGFKKRKELEINLPNSAISVLRDIPRDIPKPPPEPNYVPMMQKPEPPDLTRLSSYKKPIKFQVAPPPIKPVGTVEEYDLPYPSKPNYTPLPTPPTPPTKNYDFRGKINIPEPEFDPEPKPPSKKMVVDRHNFPSEPMYYADKDLPERPILPEKKIIEPLERPSSAVYPPKPEPQRSIILEKEIIEIERPADELNEARKKFQDELEKLNKSSDEFFKYLRESGNYQREAKVNIQKAEDNVTKVHKSMYKLRNDFLVPAVELANKRGVNILEKSDLDIDRAKAGDLTAMYPTIKTEVSKPVESVENEEDYQKRLKQWEKECSKITDEYNSNLAKFNANKRLIAIEESRFKFAQIEYEHKLRQYEDKVKEINDKNIEIENEYNREWVRVNAIEGVVYGNEDGTYSKESVRYQDPDAEDIADYENKLESWRNKVQSQKDEYEQKIKEAVNKLEEEEDKNYSRKYENYRARYEYYKQEEMAVNFKNAELERNYLSRLREYNSVNAPEMYLSDNRTLVKKLREYKPPSEYEMENYYREFNKWESEKRRSELEYAIAMQQYNKREEDVYLHDLALERKWLEYCAQVETVDSVNAYRKQHNESLKNNYDRLVSDYESYSDSSLGYTDSVSSGSSLAKDHIDRVKEREYGTLLPGSYGGHVPYRSSKYQNRKPGGSSLEDKEERPKWNPY